jgi:glycosyltransferase involved in cell wall biosynthesis
MRICLICNQIAAFGKIGGFGSMARSIGRELVRRGHELSVVCRTRPGQRREEELDGMRVVGLRAHEILTSRSVYRELGADVYHSQEPTIGTWLAQRATPDALHVVTCIDPRDDSDWRVEFTHSTRKRQLIHPIQRFYEDGHWVRRAVREADAVLCQARFIIPKVVRMYGLDGTPGFMPNPIEVPERPPQKALRPTCCFVSRFDPRKRPELFFRCVKENPEVRFIAVGRAHDAAYDAQLRREFGEIPNLELVGFVDPFKDGKLTRIYAESWILVNTAAREGLPATFLEAAAQGCALLSMVDPDEMTSRFGVRVDDDDFTRGLHSLLEGERWRTLGLEGHGYVKQNFDTPVAIQRHLDLYDRLAAQARRALGRLVRKPQRRRPGDAHHHHPDVAGGARGRALHRLHRRPETRPGLRAPGDGLSGGGLREQASVPSPGPDAGHV